MTLSVPHALTTPDVCSCFVFPPGDSLLQCSSSSPLHRVATNATATSSCSFTNHNPHNLLPLLRQSDCSDDDDIMIGFPNKSSKAKSGGGSGFGRTPPAAAAANAAATVDPYQVLQIRRDATASEIRHAYMRLALWHHPGRTALSSLTPQERARRRQVFEVLAACYETLTDKATRMRCDALLREAEQPQSSHHKRQRIKKRMLVGRILAAESLDSHPSRHGTVMPSLSSVSLDSCSTASSSESSKGNAANADDGADGAANDKTTPLVRGYPVGKVESRGDRSLRSHSSVQRQHRRPHHTRSLHQLWCGAPSISVEDEDFVAGSANHTNNKGPAADDRRHAAVAPPSSSSSSSSEMHYSERETNRLFGGPLFLLFRARRWKPLTDPYQVFAGVFGSDLGGSYGGGRPQPSMRALQPTSPAAAVPVRPSAAWTTTAATTVSSERQAHRPNGAPQQHELLVCTTTRAWPDRILVRTETIRNGRRQITVTSEPVPEIDADERKADPFFSPLALCGQCDFQLCLWE